MLYLVVADAIEGGPDVPPAQTAARIEHLLLPSLEDVTRMEKRGENYRRRLRRQES